MKSFRSQIEIIGINPFVFVPDQILNWIFLEAGKDKGPIPIKGSINRLPYQQTLVKYRGQWRLYINTTMLKNSTKRIGESVDVTIEFDPVSRVMQVPLKFAKALKINKEASSVFDKLPPSRRHEIIRYLANLKTAAALDKNITRAINFLLNKERFIGRDKPM